MSRFCASCGSEVPASGAFCGECGAAIQPVSQPETTPAKTGYRTPLIVLGGLLALAVPLVLVTSTSNNSLSSLFSAGELTRERAASLIETHLATTEIGQYVQGHVGYAYIAAEQGLWTVEKNVIQLGPELQQEISQVSGDRLFLNTPPGIKVNVTGIAADPQAQGLTDVQFTWEYTALPKLVRRLAAKGGTGSAVLRLYDDGWRTESVQYQRSTDPVELTQSEIDEREVAIQATQKKREAELAALAVLWTPRSVGQNFVYQDQQGWRKAEITDAALVFYTSSTPDGPWQREASYWYGLMPELSRTYDGGYTGRFLVWNPGGSINYSTISFDSYNNPGMGAAIDAARAEWRAKHPDHLDGKLAKERVWSAYYELYDYRGDSVQDYHEGD